MCLTHRLARHLRHVRQDRPPRLSERLILHIVSRAAFKNKNQNRGQKDASFKIQNRKSKMEYKMKRYKMLTILRQARRVEKDRADHRVAAEPAALELAGM